jgi:hypothetical protein
MLYVLTVDEAKTLKSEEQSSRSQSTSDERTISSTLLGARTAAASRRKRAITASPGSQGTSGREAR